MVLVCDKSACDPKFEPQGQISAGQFVSNFKIFTFDLIL